MATGITHPHGDDTMSPKAFRKLLSESRAALKLTKAEAARRLKIPYRSYQNWELGYRVPPPYIQEFLISTLDDLALEQIRRNGLVGN